MWPVHLWTRFNMAFDIVCMQFDKTGNDQIALTIHGAGWYTIALRNFRDEPLFDCHRTGNHLICQHKLRIGET